jgi:hypothetical protein
MDGNEGVTGAIIVISSLFVATFAMTWAPISWIYPAEIFSWGIRPGAVALCTAARWCCNVTVTLAVPHLREWKIRFQRPSLDRLGSADMAIFTVRVLG